MVLCATYVYASLLLVSPQNQHTNHILVIWFTPGKSKQFHLKHAKKREKVTSRLADYPAPFWEPIPFRDWEERNSPQAGNSSILTYKTHLANLFEMWISSPQQSPFSIAFPLSKMRVQPERRLQCSTPYQAKVPC